LKRNFGYVVPISSFIFSFTAGIKQLNMAVWAMLNLLLSHFVEKI
jgi:hypothetical protein